MIEAGCLIWRIFPSLVTKWISYTSLLLSNPGTVALTTSNSYTSFSKPAVGIVTLTGVSPSLSANVASDLSLLKVTFGLLK